jgi:hypothetical protein
MFRSKKDPQGWLALLKTEFDEGREECHAGCGEQAKELRLFGKRVGAWCKGCWKELAEGHIPPLDKPKGARPHGVINRKKLMDG